MSELIHQLIEHQATDTPDAPALLFRDEVISYKQLNASVSAVSNGLLNLGLSAGDRVAIYLPKLPKTVYSLFGTSRVGGIFVPVNPALKPQQVGHILNDSGARILITSTQRLAQISIELEHCKHLAQIVVIDEETSDIDALGPVQFLNWTEFTLPTTLPPHSRLDSDATAILYTSGSTGNPKGVVLSHQNMVIGAQSVASYLKNTPEDRLLAVLPLSFDYGFSQLTTAFCVGASVTLIDYLLPQDILKAIEKYRITGLAGIPTIWNQVIQLQWPAQCKHLRYITNSGGAMPTSTSSALQELLPDTDIFLMYGLTEAFRSTYLPPEQLQIRPTSIGKAIPGAETLVLREDGTECDPEEPGELVHTGPLVSMGYWNDRDTTQLRFKDAPEKSVWSGDQAKKDKEGYLYFLGRKDDMIKTSGYRVSPTEVEEVVLQSGMCEAAAFGVPHPMLGEAIIIAYVSTTNTSESDTVAHCRKVLPGYMQPQKIIALEKLPLNPNGKIDRKALKIEYNNLFSSADKASAL